MEQFQPPASNGLAEHAVQIIKRGLKKVADGTMHTQLAKVLLTYRVTPQSTTGQAPAELLLGRRPHTCLDLFRPNTSDRVERKQQQQKFRHDGRGQFMLVTPFCEEVWCWICVATWQDR